MKKGEKMSDEQKAEVSASRKGKALGNQNGFKKGQISPNKGKTFSPEWRQRLSQSHKGKPSPKKGKPISQEQRDLISLNRKGKYPSDETRERNRQGQIRRHMKDNPSYVMGTRNQRIANNGGFHSSGEWETLKAQYNWICLACKRGEPEITLTKDHIVPLSRGGSNNIENIQPLCGTCNRKKSAQTVKY